MKKIIQLIICAIAIVMSCTPDNKSQDVTHEEISLERSHFAKGADISWVTQMEDQGMKFYDMNGNETECTALMKSLGMNAIRLRVWVNPQDGWCGKEDVLIKAKRAHALGMDLMVDFHYSDSWADPSQQVTPSAWASYNTTQLASAVEEHTKEVLSALKDNGIDVKWVQVGNEVNNGMLHPSANISNPGKIVNFATFFNAGYNAAKEVFPSTIVILHRSNGHETAGFEWLLNVAKAQNIRYDMIGMSLYPTWWEGNGFTDWRPTVEQCISNIRNFSATYGKPVMICEFGMPVNEPQMSKEALQYILDQTKKIKACHGVFYWEPQAPDKYNGGYDKGAFKNGKPTTALDPFKETIQ